MNLITNFDYEFDYGLVYGLESRTYYINLNNYGLILNLYVICAHDYGPELWARMRLEWFEYQYHRYAISA